MEAASASTSSDPALSTQGAELNAAGSAASPAPASPPARPIDYNLEARLIWKSIGGTLGLAWPSVRGVYDEAQLEELGAAWGPVMEKHKWTAGGFLIYFIAGTSTATALARTVEAARADIAQAKASAAPAGSGDASSSVRTNEPSADTRTMPKQPASVE